MKEKIVFICTECGNESKKWFGACPACHQYNTMVEQKVSEIELIKNVNKNLIIHNSSHQKLSDVIIKSDERFTTGIKEVDRVFGGGLVRGSFSLLGGQPGIGKSTLVLQMLNQIAMDQKVMYVSGEESLSQIKSRANRLAITSSDRIIMMASNNLNDVIATCIKENIKFLVIDSIQTLYLDNVNSLQGTSSQIKSCTMELMKFSKVNEVTTIIIGHITKEGEIAGPKQLEHMVDSVLYLEMDNVSTTRILRCFKNRFGPINEIGIFKMASKGLIGYGINEFKDEENKLPEIGCAYTMSFEGNRIFLNEIQALINGIDYGTPKRVAQKIELNRLAIIIALLENKTDMQFNNEDVFVKNISQINTKENSHYDLALIAALVSVKIKRVIPKNVIFIGEVALTGKVQKMRIDQNLETLKQVGINEIIGNVDLEDKNFHVHQVTNIIEVLNYIFK